MRVGKTQVSVEHHFLVFEVGTLVNQLPLVLGGVVTHGEFRCPASSNHRVVIVVVEEALVIGVGPVTFVAGVFRASTSHSVGAGDGGSEGPCIFVSRIDIVDEDLLKAVVAVGLVAVAAVLGVGHALDVPVAGLHSCTSKLEAIAEFLGEGSLCELVVSVVVSRSSSHGGLSSDDKEIGERDVS